MKYKSNVDGPPESVLSRFLLRDPPKTIGGHDAPSDPVYEPECCYWTHDEAAILYRTVLSWKSGAWLDIGSRFGWTAAHILAADRGPVTAVDPIYDVMGMSERMMGNVTEPDRVTLAVNLEAAIPLGQYVGAVIDGNHDWPMPLRDAAVCIAAGVGMLIFHDVAGAPVQEAVDATANNGYCVKLYWTPNIVAVCWRDYPVFMPVEHSGDPRLMNDWKPVLAKTCLGRFVK